ncbi:MAG: ATP-binding protein [Bacilli bacterium]
MAVFNSWFATPLMAIELFAFSFLFSKSLLKKSYFWLRYLGLVAAVIFASFATEFIYWLVTGNAFGYSGITKMGDSFFKFFFFIGIYISVLITMCFAYQENPLHLALATASGYAVQHLMSNLYLLLTIPVNIYLTSNLELETALTIIIRELCMGCGLLMAVLWIKKNSISALYERNEKHKLLISSITVLICTGLSRLTNDNPNRDLLSMISESLYAMISCYLILDVVFELIGNDNMREEVDTYKELLHQQKEQYRLSKENIDLINIKCHDLKHQIGLLRKDSSEKNISEIEHAIMIYDSSVSTGNDALNVILREKSLQCESEKIQLTCMVHGESLSFMDTTDIYSLFGNILSNAIESVRKLDDPNKRIISFNGQQVGNLFILHEENYYDGELTFKEGLPQTTNTDKDYHGFGIKSMKRIALKYQGEMKVSAKDNIFILNFVFPLN